MLFMDPKHLALKNPLIHFSVKSGEGELNDDNMQITPKMSGVCAFSSFSIA